jgi:hypothetical protein
MVSPQPPTEVGLVFESLEASSRVAQLEAEIAQLKDALARWQQLGVATRCWPSASPITPSGPGHCWYAYSKKRPCQGTQHLSGHHQRDCGRLSPAGVEILSVIEMHMLDVRLIGARVDGQQPTSESSQ